MQFACCSTSYLRRVQTDGCGLAIGEHQHETHQRHRHVTHLRIIRRCEDSFTHVMGLNSNSFNIRLSLVHIYRERDTQTIIRRERPSYIPVCRPLSVERTRPPAGSHSLRSVPPTATCDRVGEEEENGVTLATSTVCARPREQWLQRGGLAFENLRRRQPAGNACIPSFSHY